MSPIGRENAAIDAAARAPFFSASRRAIVAASLAIPVFGALGCQPSADSSAAATANDAANPAAIATATAAPTARPASVGAAAPGTTPAAATSATTAAEASAADPASADPAADDPSADRSAGSEGDETSLPAPPRAAVVAAASAGAAKGTPDALVAETNRELHAMRSSSYEHHTAIDESAGRFDYDCSGFVGYALESADPAAWSELHDGTRARPLAKDFESFVAAIPPGTTRGHWMHVARVSDLKPGDIVSWLQPADSTSKNTGHVLVVHGAVTADRNAEAPGTFFVPIVDSTALKHGAKDSRADTNATGLGTGTILLLTDASGAPVAFRWSSGKKSRVRSTAIALGRVVP